MSIRIPVDADILDVRLGPTGASEVYLGDILVWPLGGCGVTLNLPLDETPILDKSKPSKTIASATGLVATSIGNPARDCVNFTSGDFLYVNYPINSDFLKRAFAVECDVYLANTSDVITLFERIPGPLGGTYSIKLYSTYVFFSRTRGASSAPGGADDCVKVFLPSSLQANKWYRVIVQREPNYRVTVFVKDWTTEVTTTGTTYTPTCAHPYVETFRNDLGPLLGQYFNSTNCAAADATQIKLGGAGYIANHKVTVCQAPYAGPELIPYPWIDEYYTSVALLMHFDYLEDQEFIDSGPYNLTATKFGEPTIVSVTSQGNTNNIDGLGLTAASTGQGLFAWGPGNFLLFPDAPPGLFELADSDFTLEFWAQVGGASAGGSVLGYLTPTPGRYYGQPQYGWSVAIGAFGCSQGCSAAVFTFTANGENPQGLHYYGGTGGTPCIDWVTGFPCSNRGLRVTANGYGVGIYSSFVFYPSEWNHFAVTRAGDTLRLFFNGKLVAYGPVPFSFNAENTKYAAEPDYLPPVFAVGGESPYTPASAAAKLKELRITKGVARYVSDFALQSRPWPDNSPAPSAPAAPTLLSVTQL